MNRLLFLPNSVYEISFAHKLLDPYGDLQAKRTIVPWLVSQQVPLQVPLQPLLRS